MAKTNDPAACHRCGLGICLGCQVCHECHPFLTAFCTGPGLVVRRVNEVVPFCRCPAGTCYLHPSLTTCGMRDGKG